MGLSFNTWILFYCLVIICAIHSTAQRYPFLREATDPPSPEAYDYIIVGGGTAGCPLAATLSQRCKVLVLERGGSPYGNPNLTRVENFGASLADTQGDDTPTQAFVSKEGVSNVRGRVLVGSSSINNGFYSRASPKFIRLAGLDGRLANSSFQWVERVVASIPQLGPYQSAVRSSLIEVGITPDNGATYDHIIGTKTGGSIFDSQGNRRPSSDLLVYANPGNIEVLLHATVQRVLFRGSTRRAYGVLYRDSLGRNHTAVLRNKHRSEVILCAGALGSPQLLLLSGIGPANHLRAMGISVIVNSTRVGKGIADNPAKTIDIPSPSPVEISLVQVVGITPFGSFIESESGLAPTVARRLDKVIEKVFGPLSTGELLLRTLNASDNPNVTFNYFKEPQDLQVCIGGANKLEELLLADSFRPFRFDNQTLPSGGTVAAPNRRNPAYAQSINTTITSFCRNVETIWHYHGGCLVGEVIDSKYRVFGVKGLRVVDGSTFKFSPGTNPQATIMMLGRYMGVKIMAERI